MCQHGEAQARVTFKVSDKAIFIKPEIRWALWYAPPTAALRRLRQEDPGKFKTSLRWATK